VRNGAPEHLDGSSRTAGRQASAGTGHPAHPTGTRWLWRAPRFRRTLVRPAVTLETAGQVHAVARPLLPPERRGPYPVGLVGQFSSRVSNHSPVTAST